MCKWQALSINMRVHAYRQTYWLTYGLYILDTVLIRFSVINYVYLSAVWACIAILRHLSHHTYLAISVVQKTWQVRDVDSNHPSGQKALSGRSAKCLEVWTASERSVPANWVCGLISVWSIHSPTKGLPLCLHIPWNSCTLIHHPPPSTTGSGGIVRERICYIDKH